MNRENREGYLYTLNIERLFKEIGNNLKYAKIEHTPSETGDFWDEYFDLYNQNGELACMDGETVQVVKDNGNLLTLMNSTGMGDVEFDLTETEFKTAAYE